MWSKIRHKAIFVSFTKNRLLTIIMFCQNCGNKIKEEAKFCPSCGAK